MDELTRRRLLQVSSLAIGTAALAEPATADTDDPRVVPEAVPEVNVRYDWNDGDEKAESWGTTKAEFCPNGDLSDVLVDLTAYLVDSHGEIDEVKCVDRSYDLGDVSEPVILSPEYETRVFDDEEVDHIKADHTDDDEALVHVSFSVLADETNNFDDVYKSVPRDDDPGLYFEEIDG